ncbi:hypothetical protein H312_00289 [Anncaliia algerae PRA339]|uniref:Uncharacterized protein n=1 Tax=Anncaliia algerae PRA339 TaxID=1288291 RepID=A0A059F5M4_9MICR|nr:hypothetical protein H312_00289 [Anncaliia algerae PRA339]
MNESDFVTFEKKIYSDLVSLTKEDKQLAEQFDNEEYSLCDTLDSQERIITMVEYLIEKNSGLLEKSTLEYLFKILQTQNKYFSRIIKIFKEAENSFVNELTKNYLESNQNINKMLLNIAVLNKDTKVCRNKEISDFLLMSTDFTTYNFIKSYIHSLELPCLEILLERLLQRNKNIYFYKIFTELNLKLKQKNMSLMDEEIEQDEDYVAFIFSLMVDEESIVYGFDKLYRFDYFNSLYSAIKSLIKLNRFEDKLMLPEDESFMELLLNVNHKLTNQNVLLNNKKIKQTAISLVENYFDLLSVKISLSMKSIIYKTLKNLRREEEITKKIAEFLLTDYVQKVAYLDFEQERIENEFNCTSSFLDLVSEYKHKKTKEFCFYVLTSECPTIIKSVIKIFEIERYKIENGLIYKHIKAACLKDDSVIDVLLNYCVNLKFVLRSVDLTRVIMSKESLLFFDYVKLFDDFSIYLNNDFLKRLSDNRSLGLQSLLSMKNVSDFVLKNKNYFNALVKTEKDIEIQKLIVNLYNRITSFTKMHSFSFTDESQVLLPKVYFSGLFKLFSKALIHSHINNKPVKKMFVLEELIVSEDDLKEYVDYLKVQVILGIQIKVNELIRNYSGKYIDDLIGFCRSYGYKINFDSLSLRSRIYENRKDNELFIKNYESVDKFTKFALHKTIDLNELSINSIHKKEFERILKNELNLLKIEGINSEENLLLFKSALNLLLVLDNIDSIVKLIDEFNNIPTEFNELLIKISIKNLCNGGNRYFKHVLRKGPYELQVKYLLMLYLRNLWNNEMHYWLAELKTKLHNSSDLDYLCRNISNN